MATTLATPGVYIEEKSSFGTSVVPVQTAIPAFIGYTQKAVRGSKDLTNIPTKISSFGQFEELFGGAPDTKFNIESDDSDVGFKLSFVEDTKYMLHSSMRLFFANGGDRTTENTPEQEVCEELGVQMVWGVGGGKIQSSSELVAKSRS